MRSIPHRASVWQPLLLVFLVAACSAGGTGTGAPGSDAEGRDPIRLAPKGGLDTPAVPVGAFLDGVLPPRTPNSPASSDWMTVDAFPSINLDNTIVMVSNPGDDRIYVGSQEGLVVSFENDPAASSTVAFLDLRDRVAVVFEGGFLGMAFHPEFGQSASPHRNAFYVYYSSHCPLDASRDAPDLNACDDSYPRER